MYINGRWFTETEVKAYVDKLIDENAALKEENSVILHETDRLIKEKGKLIKENEELKKLREKLAKVDIGKAALKDYLDLLDEWAEMKKLLKAAMCVIKGIADRERETHVDELCCGYCEYDSPLTESGEMLYECPGCERNDCFKWNLSDEALKLIGEDGDTNG